MKYDKCDDTLVRDINFYIAGFEDMLNFVIAQYMLCCMIPLFRNDKMLVCTLLGGGGLKKCTVCTLLKMLTFLDGPVQGMHLSAFGDYFWKREGSFNIGCSLYGF